MNDIGNAWNWRRFAVNALVAAAAIAVAVAAFDTSELLSMLLLPVALIGAGLAIEPADVAPQPSSNDFDAGSLRFPADIVEATSA